MVLCNADSNITYNKELHQRQLRICYRILYHVGLRLNEIRYLKEVDIRNAIKSAQFSAIHYKTKQAYKHVLTNKVILELKGLEDELDIVFKKFWFQISFRKE